MIYVPLLLIGVKLPQGFLLKVGVPIGDLELDSAIGSALPGSCLTSGSGPLAILDIVALRRWGRIRESGRGCSAPAMARYIVVRIFWPY
jgi:hypothetical protein